MAFRILRVVTRNSIGFGERFTLLTSMSVSGPNKFAFYENVSWTQVNRKNLCPISRAPASATLSWLVGLWLCFFFAARKRTTLFGNFWDNILKNSYTNISELRNRRRSRHSNEARQHDNRFYLLDMVCLSITGEKTNKNILKKQSLKN